MNSSTDDFYINLNFDNLEQEHGKNDSTLEYHPNTFLPKGRVFQKFSIYPENYAKTLIVTLDKLKEKGIQVSNGKYNGIISSGHTSTLASIGDDSNSFYINNIVYNNFEQFGNQFHSFEKNIKVYYESVKLIHDKGFYTKNEDKSILDYFLNKCNQIFIYVQKYDINTEFDDSILKIVDELKEIIRELNTIIYNCRFPLVDRIVNAELSLISDLNLNSFSRIKSIEINEIVCKNLEIILSSEVDEFVVRNSKFINIINGSRSNCKYNELLGTYVELLSLRYKDNNNLFYIKDNVIGEMKMKSNNKYWFESNQFNNTAYADLIQLLDEIKFVNGFDNFEEFVILPNYEAEYKRQFIELMQAAIQGGNHIKDTENEAYIRIDYLDMMIASKDIDLHTLLANYKIPFNKNNWRIIANLVSRIIK